MIAAADPQADEVPLDLEFAAGQFAGRVVAGGNIAARRGGVRIDHPLGIAADIALIRRDRGFPNRTLAEGLALGGPPLIDLLVPILEQDLGTRRVCGLHQLPRRAVEKCEPLTDHPPEVPRAGPVAAVEADRVFQQPGQFQLQLVWRGVMDGEAQHGGGQAGVFSVERNERRKRLQFHLHRRVGIAVGHHADRILAAERDVAESRAVQRARFAVDGQCELLLDRRLRLRRMRVMAVAGADAAVEDIPLPEFAIASQIELAGTNPADRHAHESQVLARQDFRRAAFDQ